ncbi:hypothetical protein GMA19_00167 [Paenibacillus polymyxa E681]|uniref:hypothetical protein n=1 Tax=Paenibacillus polymyxa TaxID=1406 RepID=UPI0001E315BB|nr:hypothetical protein [Paenibacillus polymyxa]ADM68052.1 hypothetical protein PPE_00167 [Paenibacillus polymyxa E681]QNV55047.1 hypothetical protein GE561_00167 [Paenibacillus polymyxa E681]QNV59884.1 hypothetical protein GMA19_00167 [Paenibacillus polymyxa E681]
MILWFSGLNLLLFVLLGIFLWNQKKKENQHLQSILDIVKQQSSQNSGVVICLSYHSSKHKALCELIDHVSKNKLVIVYDAPKWLFLSKQKKWTSHLLIPSTSIPHLADETRVIKFCGTKYNIINEATEYIAYQYLQNH